VIARLYRKSNRPDMRSRTDRRFEEVSASIHKVIASHPQWTPSQLRFCDCKTDGFLVGGNRRSQDQPGVSNSSTMHRGGDDLLLRGARHLPS